MTDDRKPRQLFILIDERKHHYDLMAFESLDSFNRFEDEMSELEEREKFKPHAFVELEPTLQLMKEMGEAMSEAIDLIDDSSKGLYKCDSFTNQPLKLALEKYRKFLEGI